jgi:hypothetical protein
MKLNEFIKVSSFSKFPEAKKRYRPGNVIFWKQKPDFYNWYIVKDVDELSINGVYISISIPGGPSSETIPLFKDDTALESIGEDVKVVNKHHLIKGLFGDIK